MTKSVIDAKNNIYQLLNVPGVTDAVPVYIDVKPTGNDDTVYIVVKSLTISGGQLQDGVVMVNIHAKNVEATVNGQPETNFPDNIKLKQLQDLVIPIIEDGLINDMGTEIQAITLLDEPDLKEHFLNIRVLIHYINLN